MILSRRRCPSTSRRCQHCYISLHTRSGSFVLNWNRVVTEVRNEASSDSSVLVPCPLFCLLELQYNTLDKKKCNISYPVYWLWRGEKANWHNLNFCHMNVGINTPYFELGTVNPFSLAARSSKISRDRDRFEMVSYLPFASCTRLEATRTEKEVASDEPLIILCSRICGRRCNSINYRRKRHIRTEYGGTAAAGAAAAAAAASATKHLRRKQQILAPFRVCAPALYDDVCFSPRNVQLQPYWIHIWAEVGRHHVSGSCRFNHPRRCFGLFRSGCERLHLPGRNWTTCQNYRGPVHTAKPVRNRDWYSNKTVVRADRWGHSHIHFSTNYPANCGSGLADSKRRGHERCGCRESVDNSVY